MADDVLGSLIVGLVSTILCFLVFSGLRRVFNTFYIVKAYEKQPWAPPSDYRGWFGFQWMWATISFHTQDLLNHPGGLDCIIYLTFMKYTAFLFGALSLPGLLMLLPVNFIGENKHLPESDPEHVEGVNIFSIANIERESPKYWANLVTVFLFTFICYAYIYKISSSNVKYMHWTKKNGSIQQRTVMVEDLPKEVNTDAALKAFFEKYWPGRVTHAVMGIRAPKLHALRKQRDKAAKDVRIAYDRAKEKEANIKNEGCIYRVFSKLNFLPKRDTDPMNVLQRKVLLLDRQIEDMLKQELPRARIGFVTFDSHAAAMQAAQSLLSRSLQPVVSPAPDPKDVRWHELGVKDKVTKTKLVINALLLAALFLLWTVPITLFQAVANFDNLSKVEALRPLIKNIRRSSAVEQNVKDTIGSLGIVIFMALLPYLLKFILKFRSWKTNRDFDVEVMKVYFIFMVLNVFLLASISGTLFTVINQLAYDVEFLFLLFASSIPKQAVFFMNYIIVQGLVYYPLFELIRLPDLIFAKVKQAFATTTQQKAEANFPDPPFDYPVRYARELLIFVLALTYSSMAPLILPFAALYFGFAYFTAKYNFIFVYIPPYEGVKFLRSIVDRIFVILALYQLFLLGELAISIFPPCIGILFLFPADLYFRGYIIDKFWRVSMYLPLDECSEPNTLDTVDINDPFADINMFMDPALKPLPSLPAAIEKSDPRGSSYRASNIELELV